MVKEYWIYQFVISERDKEISNEFFNIAIEKGVYKTEEEAKAEAIRKAKDVFFTWEFRLRDAHYLLQLELCIKGVWHNINTDQLSIEAHRLTYKKNHIEEIPVVIPNKSLL